MFFLPSEHGSQDFKNKLINQEKWLKIKRRPGSLRVGSYVKFSFHNISKNQIIFRGVSAWTSVVLLTYISEPLWLENLLAYIS